MLWPDYYFPPITDRYLIICAKQYLGHDVVAFLQSNCDLAENKCDVILYKYIYTYVYTYIIITIGSKVTRNEVYNGPHRSASLFYMTINKVTSKSMIANLSYVNVAVNNS